MERWQPLSVRSGKVKEDGPYEGVPLHLLEPLRQWIQDAFGGIPGSLADDQGGPILSAALRYRGFQSRIGQRLTVHNLLQGLRGEPDVMLDAVDAVLHLKSQPNEAIVQLNMLLSFGGSVWQVADSRLELVRRVDPTASEAFAQAVDPSDTASLELAEAWVRAFGRNPDASDAWDHSIKAVEAILRRIVSPKNNLATLGTLIRDLRDGAHKFQFVLTNGLGGIPTLIAMLQLMYPNPDRHPGPDHRTPTLEEARAVVHLAVTIVQWARDDQIARKE